MVRKIVCCIFVIVFTSLSAQEDYIQPGLLKATATISPTSMLNRSVSNVYISGFLEYHLEKNLSLRGDTYMFIDGESKTASPNLFIAQGMRTYFGVFYHFNKNNWDQYLGFQPGISLIKPLDAVELDAPFQAIPSFAIHVGSTYFVWKYFNFFVDLTYVNSTYRGLSTGSIRTDELILSAGLGFQVQTKRKK